MLKPSRNEFLQIADTGKYNSIPVYTEIIGDLFTPVSIFLKLDPYYKYAYLLESVDQGENIGRYSFIGIDTAKIFRSKGNKIIISIDGDESESTGDPLEYLKELINNVKSYKDEEIAPFYGGAVGYLGYDTVRFTEDLPNKPNDDTGFFDSQFIFAETVLVFDGVSRTIKVIHNTRLTDNYEADYDSSIKRIEKVLSIMKEDKKESTLSFVGNNEVSYNMTKDQFTGIVEKCKEYILQGEVIQTVLSQRIKSPLSGNPFSVYRALRIINPSPYLFYLKFDKTKLIGASPEVMVGVKDKIIRLKPIAGTRKRGNTPKEDIELANELLRDEKERAEHIMLVDLGRNDVARVSRTGTIEIKDFMFIEKYSHVMHIVSEIRGIIKDGLDIFDVIRSTFPAGTVSGAPKVRAMEIIDELEPTSRGPYAGLVGYFGYSGNFDSCITIRTILVRDEEMYIQAGAGIVADSIPEKEYVVTLNKSIALIKAIDLARIGIS